MAQHRQSGSIGGGLRNGVASDHVSIGVRATPSRHHHRRSKAPPACRISIGSCIVIILSILCVSAFFYFKLQNKDINGHTVEDDDEGNDTDFLMNVTRTRRSTELKFGRGSVAHGRDSRYWDKDDRRRDNDYNEEEFEQARDGSENKSHTLLENSDKKSSVSGSRKVVDPRKTGLYNEAGRNELKMYEAEYEASLKNIGQSKDIGTNKNQKSSDTGSSKHENFDDADEYDDGIDFQDDQLEGDEYIGNDDDDDSNSSGSKSRGNASDDSSHVNHSRNKDTKVSEAGKVSRELSMEDLVSDSRRSKSNINSGHVSSIDGQSSRKSTLEKRSGSKKKTKRRKFSGSCEMKVANSTSQLIEPVEGGKFVRFSLQYTEREEKPLDNEKWEPIFAGHQSLEEREESFIARDQKINCGFVKGPKGSPSTGFDLAEDDAKYMSSCHIAVMSCIFGNSDHLRSPTTKAVSRMSRKNVCFIMFVDEMTLRTLTSEGHMLDSTGYIGFWKIVVVKNLPYTDMRRVGKIPKFLPHRLFPSARYSIWLDSKLRLQLDPSLILEYFLWRKGYEYAISNHYDRHCLWEEVAQNKRLNKYNHTVIDEQFAFYQADGMRRFNASDPNKLLPSNVPEGSFIVRAHTPMSNLFSCLWFNEVERFTPRDQLSFAYTYQKLRRMNPEKPFYLHMFKDCERRKIAKLYHHRSEEKRSSVQQETE